MTKKDTESSKADNQESFATKKKQCGIIMPIADMEGFRSGHWNDVRRILEDVIIDCEYNPRLVSDSVETRVIHDNIVNNIYNDEIIVCDISGRNANVMFELGMRLAFNKPVVVVKDHETDYAFDTGIIFQETYPRDLRFTEIEVFKLKLKARILGTVAAIGKPEAKSFLDNFGTFKIQEIKDKDVPVTEYFNMLLQEVKDLKTQISYNNQSTQKNPSEFLQTDSKGRILPPPPLSTLTPLSDSQLNIIIKDFIKKKNYNTKDINDEKINELLKVFMPIYYSRMKLEDIATLPTRVEKIFMQIKKESEHTQ